MSEQPLISIITPVYNAERFLKDTMNSIQAQTYLNWEWILVDDASSDQSVLLIEQAMKEDSRIRLIKLSYNQGAAVARNTGLEQALGDYIAFIDSDDYWLPDKLMLQLTFMQKYQYSFTYTAIALVNESGEILKEKVPIPEFLDYHTLLKNTAIACSTVMIDRTKTGDFRMPLVRKGQDTATWLMLLRPKGKKAYGLDQVLNYYRQVEGSISSNKLSALKRTWYTYRHLEKLSLTKSIYYFSHYVWNAVRRRL